MEAKIVDGYIEVNGKRVAKLCDGVHILEERELDSILENGTVDTSLVEQEKGYYTGRNLGINALETIQRADLAILSKFHESLGKTKLAASKQPKIEEAILLTFKAFLEEELFDLKNTEFQCL